ncbi:type II RES/Xre toxin-antitoxin system antitoxin [Flagellimonas halotolerans]|uniref:Antitoxin Xre/MbcA/ParS toxin-binding domain-containing protein n=1 Tax=Flagellimonas halotolerans TaxID=3112164 RepID=A0ABU6IV80_9FLAO|nr:MULTISPECIES: antitoxin Xre/MbcA/ParS toxin-binding domain-containing protein [unclassified Allomuricauda]MEC3967033.1 antitoxin Xre/MbcA/ParS toxin-binding domain-containing protein [Muricauda sp. SYSU M86414]MEC4266892.1 antitoxin Xre/MbcA/ParS toxin-binding domain-containing protein [Muricauda sp. SYSU M84420]
MLAEKQKEHSNDLTAVDKAIKVYVRSIGKSSQIKIKAKNITYSDFFENKMLIIRAIREGLPYKLFSEIKEITPFTEDDWAEYLNLSKKTLQRHSNDANYLFKPIHTEKIIELAEVTNFGNEVFDSAEQFYLWLNTPSYALGNLKPAELLKDSYGKELVMGELNRIDQGIFA